MLANKIWTPELRDLPNVDLATISGRSLEDVRERVGIHGITCVGNHGLGILNPYDFDNLESMRAEIVTTIDEHLSRLQIVPRVIYGEPFYFMQSRITEVPTGRQAWTLTEFHEILATVDASAVYYHTLAAMLRLGRREGDFTVWLKEQLGLADLAEAFSKLDMSSLESIRLRMVKLCDTTLRKEARK